MRREAIEVFYSDACFDFYNNDLGSTLSFLRDVLPREGLSQLRRIRFTMTEAQCEGWAGGAVASGYPARMLESQVAVPYWGGGPAPRLDHKADWRAVIAVLAARADLPRLTVTIEMGECAWAFVEDTLMWEEPPDLSMFRFIYDFYMDVATAMCALKGLGGLDLDLGAFHQLRPWLERGVLGYKRERTGLSPHARRLERDLWRRPRFYQLVPPWHDVNQRLDGSNYRPDQ
jgi:hypothetical protein